MGDNSWFTEQFALCGEIVNNPKFADLMRDPQKVAYVLNNSGKLAKLAASTMREKADFLGAANMEKSGQMLSKMGAGVAKGADYMNNGAAILGIYDAWMNLDPASIRKNPEASAKQFGRLFKHAGNLSSTLPFPFNAYADFLGGFENFFDDVRQTMDPQSRKTPRGRMMDDLFPELTSYRDI